MDSVSKPRVIPASQLTVLSVEIALLHSIPTIESGFMWFWGAKLRTSHLHNRCFTH